MLLAGLKAMLIWISRLSGLFLATKPYWLSWKSSKIFSLLAYGVSLLSWTMWQPSLYWLMRRLVCNPLIPAQRVRMRNDG